MVNVIKINEPTECTVVGRGPVTVDDGFLIPTERPGVYDHRTVSVDGDDIGNDDGLSTEWNDDEDSSEFPPYEPPPSDPDDSEQFDPAKHTGAQVISYLNEQVQSDNRDEFNRVADAERDGFNRSAVQRFVKRHGENG